MEKELKMKIYGQDLVIRNLVEAFRKNYSEFDKKNKPLVLSLHGMPGTGKSFTVDIIVKHFFFKGADSTYFHHYSANKDFFKLSDSHNSQVY